MRSPSPVRARNPLTAGLLSLAGNGMGQLYNGQPGLTALFYGLEAGFMFATGMAGLLDSREGLGVFLGVELLLKIVAVSQAVLAARARRAYRLRPYNRWQGYALFYLFALLVTGVVVATSWPPLASLPGLLRP